MRDARVFLNGKRERERRREFEIYSFLSFERVTDNQMNRPMLTKQRTMRAPVRDAYTVTKPALEIFFFEILKKKF